MIWRDDDIQWRTKGERLDLLKRVDDHFQREGLPHTIAVIAERLDENPVLVETIKERRMIVQLHAWNHDADLVVSEAARDGLAPAMAMLTHCFGYAPTVLYPPWNRSNADVEAVAKALGLVVSTKKVSLEQYLRFGGEVREDTVNFHYWDLHEHELLPTALATFKARSRAMKPTDYCPRAAPFDVYLRDRRAQRGVEVGVDAGAHAEALLRYCDIDHLWLVDLWPNAYHYGYCQARLREFGAKTTMLQTSSVHALTRFNASALDFVYCDETRDAETAMGNMARWWPLIKAGGLLGYRGYGGGDALSLALDQWLREHPDVPYHLEPGELILEKP